jgi:hypothetical protein
MKLNVLALALAATLAGSLTASAQTTVIEEKRDPAVVVKEKPAADVVVKERVGEPKVIKKETVGASDCSSKTIHKEGLGESKTVTKTNCD